MKIQIIQLDRHDDVLSIRDKITWSKSPRILLIWPDHNKLYMRRVDLALLRRSGEQVGTQLGLVTRDPEVIESADDEGIAVFKSITQAQKTHWRHNRKPGLLPNDRALPHDLRADRLNIPAQVSSSWLENRWTQFLVFSVAVASLLALMAAFIPTAKIEITPQTRTQTIIIPVVASDQFKAVNLTGNIPAHSVSVIVEGKDQIQTTGKISIPDQKAYGIAQFTNLTSQAVPVPVGTIIRTINTPEIRYTTTGSGTVNPGPGSILSIPIQAISPGEVSNLPSFSLVAIEGPLGLQLSVANTSPIYNGTSRLGQVASQDDYNQLRQRLIKSMQNNALTQLGAKLSPDDQIIPGSLTLKNVLDESRTPDVGVPSDTLTLSLRLEFSNMVVSGETLRTLANAALNATINKSDIPIDGSLKITPLGQPVMQDLNGSWQIKAQREVMTDLTKDQLVTGLTGLSPREVSSLLVKRYSLKQPPVIQVNPAWWPRLPVFPFQITIVQTGV